MASASGGAGPGFGVSGGAAKAYASGVAVTGNVQANASAKAGASGPDNGTAFALSAAKNASGEVVTRAAAIGAADGYRRTP